MLKCENKQLIQKQMWYRNHNTNWFLKRKVKKEGLQDLMQGSFCLETSKIQGAVKDCINVSQYNICNVEHKGYTTTQQFGVGKMFLWKVSCAHQVAFIWLQKDTVKTIIMWKRLEFKMALF